MMVIVNAKLRCAIAQRRRVLAEPQYRTVPQAETGVAGLQRREVELKRSYADEIWDLDRCVAVAFDIPAKLTEEASDTLSKVVRDEKAPE